MLTSQSIPFLQLQDGAGHHILVEEHWARTALEQLLRYEEENKSFRLGRALPPAAPLARLGTAAFVLVLAAAYAVQARAPAELDWRERGIASASAIRTGEIDRTATALTLHADVPHLLSNVVFGALFTYLLFHAWGGGLGLLAVLLAGMLGNWMNAWVHAGAHHSLGASTAVFAAVGLLAGSEARARHLLREVRARRFAPIGAALLLLLYLGVGEVQSDRHVDVLAHVFGLSAGLALGGFVGSIPRAWVERRDVQLACALAAGALLAASWAVAIGR